MGSSLELEAAVSSYEAAAKKTLKDYLGTTPGRMTAALVSCLVAALLMGVCAFGAYYGTRQAVQTVGKDAVPSIVAAERIRATLGDAHGNAMNAIVNSEAEDGPSLRNFRKDMDQVHGDLLAASRNITYGEEEAKPILALTTKLAEYERVIGQVKGQSKEGAMATILAANSLMHAWILPAAVELDQANFKHLTATFTAHRDNHLLAALPFLVCTVLTLLALAVAQTYLLRKTHRMFNPALVAATVVTLGFGLYTVFTLNAVETALVSIKQDSFDSVHALWKAKALASDANADESMYLILDGRKADQLNAFENFRSKSAELMAEEPVEALASAMAKRKIKGLLGDELANVTFPGEAEAAFGTLRAWCEYRTIDLQIVAMLKAGHYADALKLDLGSAPGQSNWAFDRFDKALGRTLEINQNAFNDGVDKAFQALVVFPYVLGLALAAIILACLFGMKPRLDEYRF